MRGGGGDGVEDLAARGVLPHQVIPGSLPKLTAPNHTNRGVRDAITPVCFEFETCEPVLHPLGATVDGPTLLGGSEGKAARGIGRIFCVSEGDTGRLTRVVRCAVFSNLGHCTGRCHQTREGNTDRSTQWHRIVSFWLDIPCPRTRKYCPMPIMLDGRRNADRCFARLSEMDRALKVGYSTLDGLKR